MIIAALDADSGFDHMPMSHALQQDAPYAGDGPPLLDDSRHGRLRSHLIRFGVLLMSVSTLR
jgi:hypothetical protein